MNIEKKEIVVIIGSGRSGTSLLVQLLLKMGLHEYNNFAAANLRDPNGLFEDAEILAMHKGALNKLGVHDVVPKFNRDFTPGVRAALKKRMAQLLALRLEDADGKMWGFKDPRTISFLPIWKEVFNEMNIRPLYVLAVRSPSSVVTSMLKRSDIGQPTAELLWLWRNVEAIVNTEGDVHIVHYEGWFEKGAIEKGVSLAKFLSLKPQGVESILRDNLASGLNRSQSDVTFIENSDVIKLYNQLKICSGDDFDSIRLQSVAEACAKRSYEYAGWAEMANQLYGRLTVSQNDLEKVEKAEIRLEKIEIALREKIVCLRKNVVEYKEFASENSELLRSNKGLLAQNKKLSSKNSELLRSNKGLLAQNNKLRAKRVSIINSLEFKLGKLLVSSFTRRPHRILYLPYRIYRIIKSNGQ